MISKHFDPGKAEFVQVFNPTQLQTRHVSGYR